MTATRRARRLPTRLTIAFLTVLLVFFGVQTAFHSVHHLDGHDHRPSCPVLLASCHVHATLTAPVELPMPTALAVVAPISLAARAATSTVAAYQGRAPPTTPVA